MAGPDEVPRPRMLTRPLVLVFVSSFGFSTSFYLMLSVVPLYATSVGSGGAGAGLATGALMLSTVAAELVTPLLVSRFGYRAVFAAGFVLLGAPAFALGAVHARNLTPRRLAEVAGTSPDYGFYTLMPDREELVDDCEGDAWQWRVGSWGCS